MTDYRRWRVPGGCYFFTVNLARRKNNSLLIQHVDLLREAFRKVKQAHPFHFDAIVVLPEHLHCVLTLPDGDYDYSIRWRQIKSTFSEKLQPVEYRSHNRRKNERGIWQQRFWEHVIRNEEDYAAHVDYVHYNPVNTDMWNMLSTGHILHSTGMSLAVCILRIGAILPELKI